MSFDSLKGFSGTLSKGFPQKFFQFFCQKSRKERRGEKTKKTEFTTSRLWGPSKVVKNLQDS